MMWLQASGNQGVECCDLEKKKSTHRPTGAALLFGGVALFNLIVALSKCFSLEELLWSWSPHSNKTLRHLPFKRLYGYLLS